jgi:hypothetical protein
VNPETTLVWHPLREALTELRKSCLRSNLMPPHWDRVENASGVGTPDLSIAWGSVGLDGHLELKWRNAPPVRDLTPVVIDSIMPEQRLWWRQRAVAGGNIKVLLRLGVTYYLFAGHEAALGLGQWTMEELEAKALVITNRIEPVLMLTAMASMERL